MYQIYQIQKVNPNLQMMVSELISIFVLLRLKKNIQDILFLSVTTLEKHCFPYILFHIFMLRVMERVILSSLSIFSFVFTELWDLKGFF